MKLIAVLLIAVVAALVLLLIWELMTQGFTRIGQRMTTEKQSNTGWRVQARTHEDAEGLPSERSLWLLCPGEPDFFVGRWRVDQPQDKWEGLLLDAEVTMNEFNRLRAQGRKELRG
jgi:hypothetical protein